MQHCISKLEEEIKKDINRIEARGAYHNITEVRNLKDELELWSLLHKFKEHTGHNTAEYEAMPKAHGFGSSN